MESLAVTEPVVVEHRPPQPSAGAPSSTGVGRPARPRLSLVRRIGRRRLRTLLRRGPLVLALAAVLYYGPLGLSYHRIDDSPAFTPSVAIPGGSQAVNMAAGLMHREVNANPWLANDPWFAPNAFLDNTPNYQLGISRAVGRFSFEMLDQLSRRRGSSSMDRDLERATGFLQYPGDIWVFNFEQSWLPAVSSEDQYRAGLSALLAYNDRVARGQAVFERRADTFAATLSRISADIGSETAQLQEQVTTKGWWIFSMKADDVFYRNKGMLYAYALILEGLGQDFADLIAQRGLTTVWEQALASLRAASQVHPLVVVNGVGDDSIFANHLLLQGFYMKRAILQLEEVVSVTAV